MLADHLNPHFSTLTPDSLAQTSSVSITSTTTYFSYQPQKTEKETNQMASQRLSYVI